MPFLGKVLLRVKSLGNALGLFHKDISPIPEVPQYEPVSLLITSITLGAGLQCDNLGGGT